jgi:murein L,D-transpeptidase YcbB/YkuD
MTTFALRTFRRPAGLALLLAFAACGPREMPPEVRTLLQTTVEVRPLPAALREPADREHLWTELQRFYEKRRFEPAWAAAEGPLPRAEALLATVELTGPEGLPSRLYGRDELARRLAALRAESWDLDTVEGQRQLVDLDVTLSYAFLTLADHLASGRQHPSELNIAWYTKPRNLDLDAVLARALDEDKGDGDGLRTTLASLTPPGPGFNRLRKSYAGVLAQAAQGGWPRIPDGPALASGAAGPRVALLRARLAASGDLPAVSGAAAGAPYDATVEAGVRRFQSRHGLEPTGTVDDATLAALNVPAAERAAQMALNLERWRWLPTDLGRRYLLVNVPELELRVVEDAKTTLTMRVIVGKQQSKTPVFSDQMTYLELNPHWNLPDSIVRDEVAPKLAADPGYLASQNMEVVRGWDDEAAAVDPSEVDWAAMGRPGSPWRVRQRPGAGNALGQVKFMFPNQFNVYLHDTPADRLFDRNERDFSHGCVRVEHPVALAAHLLRADPKWSRPAIEAALATGEGRAIRLPGPLPVHILYWTAWVDEDGSLQFRDDVYGHDAALAKALDEEQPYLPDLPALRGERRAAVR